MKRVLDVVLASVALLVLALPLLIVMGLVRRKLGSPVFFRQTRAGLDGKPFEVIKFRTMTDERGADGELLPDAQRITPFGWTIATYRAFAISLGIWRRRTAASTGRAKLCEPPNAEWS